MRRYMLIMIIYEFSYRSQINSPLRCRVNHRHLNDKNGIKNTLTNYKYKYITIKDEEVIRFYYS